MSNIFERGRPDIYLSPRDSGKDLDRELRQRMDRAEVLYGLTMPRGGNIGVSLVETIRKPQYKKVVFIGPPGVGKSVTADQLKEELEFLSKGKIVVEEEKFDNVLAATEKELGPRSGWGVEQWSTFNQRLYARWGSPSQFPDKTMSAKKIIDTMSMGNNPVRNRGVIALENAAVDAIEQEDTLFAFFLPDPRVQRRSGMVRRDLTPLELRDESFGPNVPVVRDEEITSYLNEVYNLVFLGSSISGVPLFDQLSEAEKGAFIRATILKAAPEPHIRIINNEIVAQGRAIKDKQRGRIRMDHREDDALLDALPEGEEEMREMVELFELVVDDTIQRLHIPRGCYFKVRNNFRQNRTVKNYVHNEMVLAV